MFLHSLDRYLHSFKDYDMLITANLWKKNY